MKRNSIGLTLASLTLAIFIIAPTAYLPLVSTSSDRYAQMEDKALRLINEQREARGLRPLVMEPRLREAARTHSIDLGEHSVCRHEGSDGSSPWDRVARFGYIWRMAAETVGCGYFTPEWVVRGWMSSPPHREILLSEDYVEIGIGVAHTTSGWRMYWTADYMYPRDDDLLNRVNYGRAGLKQLAKDNRLVYASIWIVKEKSENGRYCPSDRTPVEFLVAEALERFNYHDRRGQFFLSCGTLEHVGQVYNEMAPINHPDLEDIGWAHLTGVNFTRKSGEPVTDIWFVIAAEDADG